MLNLLRDDGDLEVMLKSVPCAGLPDESEVYREDGTVAASLVVRVCKDQQYPAGIKVTPLPPYSRARTVCVTLDAHGCRELLEQGMLASQVGSSRVEVYAPGCYPTRDTGSQEAVDRIRQSLACRSIEI